MITRPPSSAKVEPRSRPQQLHLPSGAGVVGGLSALGLGLLAAADPAQPPGMTITPGEPGEFRLAWATEVLRPYQVEGSADLREWTDEGEAVVGTGGVVETTVPARGTGGFFRLRQGAVRPGFDAVVMSRGDDHSYSSDGPQAPPTRVELGFPVNFFGATYTSCYVNNNGNITFDAPLLSYTPEALIKSRAVMIAPFWADVDTRNTVSNVTRFSLQPGTVNGRPAFGVSWRDVGYFSFRVDKTNTFQVVLVNRCDRAEGDFDIEFNYNRIVWETGEASGGILGFGGSPARVGWTNGNGLFMEFKGSGASLALLDAVGGQPNFTSGLIYQDWNSGVPGRILIRVVNGHPQTEPGMDFTVDAGPDITLPNDAGRDFGLAAVVTPPDTTGLSYSWILENGPTEEVVFTNANTATPTVRIPEPGTYVFRVSAVKQGAFTASSSDSVTVTHPGAFDVYAGGTYDCSGTSPRMFRLDGAYARFNNQNLTKLLWKQTSGPVGGSIQNSSTIHPDVVLPVHGTYSFTLTATSDHLPGFEKTSIATVIFSPAP